MRKIRIKTLAFLLALFTLILPLASCGQKIDSKPDIAISDAIDKTIELSAENETVKTLEKLGNAGNMEMNWELSDFVTSVISAASGGIGLSLSSKIALHMKSDLDMDKGESSGRLGIVLNDAEFIGLDFYGNKQAIAIGSNVLLGDKVLGTSIDGFTSLLESMTGDVQIPENMNETELTLTPEQIEELKPAFESYCKLALKELYENCPAERTEETLTIQGKEVEAVVFTNSFGEQQFNDIFKSLYEAYKADAETKQLVESLLLDSGMTQAELAEGYAVLEEELSEPAEDLETVVTLKIAIRKDKGNLLQVTVLKNTTEFFDLLLPADPAKPDYAKLTVPDATITFEADETETEKSFSLVVSNIEDVVKLEGKLQKETDAYTLSLTADGTVVSLTGSFKLEKHNLLFAIDTLTIDNAGQKTSIKVGLSIAFTAGKANVAPMPAYTDITTMTPDQMNQLGNELMTALSELIPMLPKDIQTILSMIMMG